jgi:anti-sigma regulatory factor (Ser/Thr protein kinase)
VIRLQIPAALSYRDIVVRLIEGACRVSRAERRALGMDDEQDVAFCEQLITAVGEAFNNTVLHAYRGELGEVLIEIEPRAGDLRVRISDQGESFDPSVVPAPKLDRVSESGMGLYIMRSCVDELSYTRGQPNILELVKRYGSAAP